jgi:hypothetical protein
MSTTTESPFSLTVKVGRNNDLLTGRADTAEEMLVRVQQLKQIAASLQDVAQVQEPAPVQDAVAQAISNLAAGGITGTVVPGELEVITDKWGSEWTYNHPDAPDLPDGRGKYARKKGTGKSGKPYTGWFDPAKGPKPFTRGAVEAETIWPQR